MFLLATGYGVRLEINNYFKLDDGKPNGLPDITFLYKLTTVNSNPVSASER